MNTPLLVILGIAALLAVLYFFGGGNGGSGCSSGKCHKKVRFNDQMGGCSGGTCGI